MNNFVKKKSFLSLFLFCFISGFQVFLIKKMWQKNCFFVKDRISIYQHQFDRNVCIAEIWSWINLFSLNFCFYFTTTTMLGWSLLPYIGIAYSLSWCWNCRGISGCSCFCWFLCLRFAFSSFVGFDVRSNQLLKIVKIKKYFHSIFPKYPLWRKGGGGGKIEINSTQDLRFVNLKKQKLMKLRTLVEIKNFIIGSKLISF